MPLAYSLYSRTRGVSGEKSFVRRTRVKCPAGTCDDAEGDEGAGEGD
jgi:hypothetical protein